jgi:hypothetical protein
MDKIFKMMERLRRATYADNRTKVSHSGFFSYGLPIFFG